MTRLWPDGAPIVVQVDDDGRPLHFTWQGRAHPVELITRHWRVRVDWWRAAAWREHFKLVTTTGLFVIIYCDLQNNEWFLQRLFD